MQKTVKVSLRKGRNPCGFMLPDASIYTSPAGTFRSSVLETFFACNWKSGVYSLVFIDQSRTASSKHVLEIIFLPTTDCVSRISHIHLLCVCLLGFSFVYVPSLRTSEDQETVVQILDRNWAFNNIKRQLYLMHHGHGNITVLCIVWPPCIVASYFGSVLCYYFVSL